MTTPLSTKLAALAVALMVNGVMLGAVAVLFSGNLHQQAAFGALLQSTAARAAASTI